MPESSTAGDASRRHRLGIQVRWADTDALGHINNVSFASFAETARIAFLSSIASPTRTFILAHLSLDFRSQIRYGQRVEVETWVEAIGRSSVTLRHHILADGVLAGDGKAIVVHFDFETQHSHPWTPELRTLLAGWLPS